MKRTLLAVLSALLLGSAMIPANDWPQWRGPERNGISRETGLPETWDPDTGENVVWKNHVAGMSSPIVMDGRVYAWTRVGEVKVAGTTVVGPETQESLVCVDAATGRTVWEHRVNMYQTEVPFHRLGWGNVAGDPQGRRVYGYGVQGTLVCLDAETGKLVWEHQMMEQFGMISTFGGRTQSPAVDEDQVFLTGVAFGWGDHSQGQHRIFAFDKVTGELRWTAGTGGRPVDAPMGTPIVAVVGGRRIVAFGAGDGGVYGFKARTGEKVFGHKLSKRGINATVLISGSRLIAGTGEEAVDNPQLGRVVCLDLSQVDGATLEPKVTWKIDGLEVGFASPTIDPDGKTVYVPDTKGTVRAIEMESGKELWKQATGTIGRPSLVWADGKIYAAEANGRFSIIQPPAPGGKRAKVLSKVEIASDAQQLGREYFIFGSPAVSNGRIYLQTAAGTFCIGSEDAAPRSEHVPDGLAEGPGSGSSGDGSAAPAVAQVVPADVLLRAGEKVRFGVRTYDAAGRLIAESEKAEFSVDLLAIPAPPTAPPGTPAGRAGNLKGSVDSSGVYSSEGGPIQAGAVTATVKAGGKELVASARVRVLPPVGMSIDFEASPAEKPPLAWTNAGGKFRVRELPGEGKVLVKTLDLDLYHLARTYFGDPAASDYTIESDIRVGSQETGGQRYMPDAGVINGRYTLVLYGSHQECTLIAWAGALPKEDQAGSALHESVPFKWEPNVWYRAKLTVRQESDGADVRGKVWKRGDPEPEAWTVALRDPLPNRSGSPGLYGESLVTPYKSEIHYDNIVVTPGK